MCALWKLGLWELEAIVVTAFCENHCLARGYSGAARRGRRGDESVGYGGISVLCIFVRGNVLT